MAIRTCHHSYHWGFHSYDHFCQSRVGKENNELHTLVIIFWYQYWYLRVVPFFKQDKVARESLIGVGALTLLNSGISVAFSYISRDFYNALNARDESLFYEKIELFFAALLIAVPVAVYYRFLREKLSIYWREALTGMTDFKFKAVDFAVDYQISFCCSQSPWTVLCWSSILRNRNTSRYW